MCKWDEYNACLHADNTEIANSWAFVKRSVTNALMCCLYTGFDALMPCKGQDPISIYMVQALGAVTQTSLLFRCAATDIDQAFHKIMVSLTWCRIYLRRHKQYV